MFRPPFLGDLYYLRVSKLVLSDNANHQLATGHGRIVSIYLRHLSFQSKLTIKLIFEKLTVKFALIVAVRTIVVTQLICCIGLWLNS